METQTLASAITSLGDGSQRALDYLSLAEPIWLAIWGSALLVFVAVVRSRIRSVKSQAGAPGGLASQSPESLIAASPVSQRPTADVVAAGSSHLESAHAFRLAKDQSRDVRVSR